VARRVTYRDASATGERHTVVRRGRAGRGRRGLRLGHLCLRMRDLDLGMGDLGLVVGHLGLVVGHLGLRGGNFGRRHRGQRAVVPHRLRVATLGLVLGFMVRQFELGVGGFSLGMGNVSVRVPRGALLMPRLGCLEDVRLLVAYVGILVLCVVQVDPVLVVCFGLGGIRYCRCVVDSFDILHVYEGQPIIGDLDVFAWRLALLLGRYRQGVQGSCQKREGSCQCSNPRPRTACASSG